MRVVNLTGPTKLVKERETRTIKEVFVIYPQCSLLINEISFNVGTHDYGLISRISQ